MSEMSPDVAARLFSVTGDVTRVLLPRDAGALAALLGGLVGGDIEVIALGDDECLVLCEVGKIIGLPRNVSATSVAHRLGAILGDDYIAGVALAVPNEAFH